MSSTTKLFGLVSILVLAGSSVALGCASTPPPRELLDARAAYQTTITSPGAARAEADVAAAKKALDRAETSFVDDPGSEATRTYAYVASRKAVAARAKGSAAIAVDDNKVAQAELKDLRAQQEMAMRIELEKAKGQVASERAALSSEKQARVAAEEKTKEALDKIAGMKSSMSDRGLILTLSGSVLFATGKSALLPAAQARLNEAAKALQADGRSITIVGHTDSVGSDEMNQALSLKRAEAVRLYLTTHGVAADKVKAEGAGETQPIADNSTPDGRASNRRVEIILENGNK